MTSVTIVVDVTEDCISGSLCYLGRRQGEISSTASSRRTPPKKRSRALILSQTTAPGEEKCSFVSNYQMSHWKKIQDMVSMIPAQQPGKLGCRARHIAVFVSKKICL
ncbi:hypothetical protein MRX96_006198 [Rhipicephalus microplus]